MAREDIYKVARALSRDLSRARRQAQRDCPSTPYQHDQLAQQPTKRSYSVIGLI